MAAFFDTGILFIIVLGALIFVHELGQFLFAKRAHDEFGFLRMWSIYPAQIKPIVEAMAPDFSEVQTGCEILLAAQAAS